MSSPAYERGVVLLQQGRPELADREFRRALAADPDDPLTHAMLSFCLGHREGTGTESLREAEEAVRLGPDEPFCHYARSRALLSLDRLADAEGSAQEAIRLDPSSATYAGMLARVEICRRRWPDALAAADRGLALDPDDDTCANLRATALVQLGRKEEAAATLGARLADDPENAWTHANQGWTYLHRNDPSRALEHFREALRLDPELEWARSGIVEALKARHLPYRLMLGFFLWVGRQGRVAQWALLLGFVFGRRALGNLARTHPALAPYAYTILLLTFAFLLLTWVASPLFNLLLRLNKFGRMALSRDERVESNWVGGCFALAALALLSVLALRSFDPLIAAAYFGFLMLPVTLTFRQRSGRPRWLAAAYTAGLAALGLPALSLVLLGNGSPFANDPAWALELFGYFLIGVALSTWIPALLSLRPLS